MEFLQGIIVIVGLSGFLWMIHHLFRGPEDTSTVEQDEETEEDTVAIDKCPVGMFTYDDNDSIVFGMKTTPDANGKSLVYAIEAGSLLALADTAKVRPVTEDELSDFVDDLY